MFLDVTQGGIRVATLNVQGLREKLQAFRHLLVTSEVDIWCLQEANITVDGLHALSAIAKNAGFALLTPSPNAPSPVVIFARGNFTFVQPFFQRPRPRSP